MERLTAPRLLLPSDETTDFDCGEFALNDWLSKRALTNHLSGASRCFVTTANQRVVGYYCLSSGSIEHAKVPGKLRRNMPNPIPVIVMGRLAVDRTFHGRGLGSGLLRHALEQSTVVGQSIGVKALLVHAKDSAAAAFYARHGFVTSPLDSLTLMVGL